MSLGFGFGVGGFTGVSPAKEVVESCPTVAITTEVSVSAPS